jgi:hypothetical protein
LFRKFSLCKNEDPDPWIPIFEQLRIELEDMGLSVTDHQFMIHVLKNITSDYELQLVLLENRIVNEKNMLEVNEIREELNLRFERLSIQSEYSNESRSNEEQALITEQFKDKCLN